MPCLSLLNDWTAPKVQTPGGKWADEVTLRVSPGVLWKKQLEEIWTCAFKSSKLNFLVFWTLTPSAFLFCVTSSHCIQSWIIEIPWATSSLGHLSSIDSRNIIFRFSLQKKLGFSNWSNTNVLSTFTSFVDGYLWSMRFTILAGMFIGDVERSVFLASDLI